MKFGYERGWTGAFTRAQADEAITNGSKVTKVGNEAGDATPIGTVGTVLGSIDAMKIDPELVRQFNARFMYFVEWQDKPKVAVCVVDRKIRIVS